MLLQKHWLNCRIVVLLSTLFLGLGLTHHSQAQDAISFAPYSLEMGASLGVNLPYDLWGTPGSLSVMGLQGALSVSPKGSLAGGFLVHHSDPDRAYTLDISYRYEMATSALNTVFFAGIHYSLFDLEIDYDEDGNCVPTNCQTDSGQHYGLMVGAGIQMPLTPYTPFRLNMKFYKNPQLWLLLEAVIGFRF